MNAITNLINVLQELPKQLPKFFVDVVNEHKDEVEDINAEQLSLGKDAKGDDLRTYRSPSYARFKKSRGSKSSPVADLKLTGKYHRAITVKQTGRDFQVTNTDSKFQELNKKYPDHLGINDDGKTEMADDFLIAGMGKEIEIWLASRT